MKKFLSFLLAACLLTGSVPVLSQEEPNAKMMHALKTETEYSWAEGQSYIARYVDSGDPVPLSDYQNGYVYAYAAKDAKLEIAKEEPVTFSDTSGDIYRNTFADFLSLRGVIKGNDDGTFAGEEVLTRAQMAAILARVLDLEPGAAPEFADVSADNWFYQPISELRQSGILAADKLFYPDRIVTRQELMTMAARALDYMGALNPVTEAEKQQVLTGEEDFDTVSDYAKEAYLSLFANGYQVLMETDYHVDEDLSDDTYRLSPNQPITRQEAAQFLYYFIRNFLNVHYPAIARDETIALGLDKEMPRIDGSTSSYPITQMIYSLLFENGQNHSAMPEQHSKTITSYEKLIAGDVDIILVPDPNSEVKQLAEDKGVKLNYIPIANEALVFFTGKQNPMENLTSDQIKKIYVENAYENWKELGGPDAPLAAFCRNNDSGSHAQMERFFLNGSEINEQIRKERTSVMMASILTDVSGCERENPGTYALGYSMYYYFKNAGSVVGNEDLKLLSVDGTMPTEENIANNSYALSTNYFAVIRDDEPEASSARKLADWLTGKSGQTCISHAGFGPVHPELTTDGYLEED